MKIPGKNKYLDFVNIFQHPVRQAVNGLVMNSTHRDTWYPITRDNWRWVYAIQNIVERDVLND